MNHPDSANGLIDKQVASSICPCGSTKKEGRPFCFDCYVRIPFKCKDGLKLRGERFYQAYEEAIEYLKEIGEIRK